MTQVGHEQILDGAAIGHLTHQGDVSTPRSYLLACYPKAQIPPMDRVVGTAEPLVARVNHGRWIASCSCGAPPRYGIPNPGMVVFLDIPLGWCVRCSNQAWGGGWRPVVVPDVDERARIEAVLICRPNVGDRNWEPTETVADLVAQNLEHGDPVPALDEVSIGPLHGPPRLLVVAPFDRASELQRQRGSRWWRTLTGRR